MYRQLAPELEIKFYVSNTDFSSDTNYYTFNFLKDQVELGCDHHIIGEITKAQMLSEDPVPRISYNSKHTI